MNIAEVLALSDSDLDRNINQLEQTSKQRARDDKTGLTTVTVEAAQAAKSLVPLITERNRRADQKRKDEQNAKFDAETAKREADEARLRKMKRQFGNGGF